MRHSQGPKKVYQRGQFPGSASVQGDHDKIKVEGGASTPFRPSLDDGIAPHPGPVRGLRNPGVRSSCRLRRLRRPGGPTSLVSGDGTEPAVASLHSSPSLELLPRSMELTACAQPS